MGVGVRSAVSRDAYQVLRRVERQQVVVERAYAAGTQRLRLADLARDLGVSERTMARDVERLRLSGVPLRTHRGHGGGVSLDRSSVIAPVPLDLPEIAALLASLAAVGPSVSDSASSAMRKLVSAISP